MGRDFFFLSLIMVLALVKPRRLGVVVVGLDFKQILFNSY
jgi:hypothetical protein